MKFNWNTDVEYRNMANIFALSQDRKSDNENFLQRPTGRTTDASFFTDSSFVLNLVFPLSL
jgi:hypothetical protein